MKNSIDLKKCLSVYDRIVTDGELRDGKYHFQGMEAWTDFDGYTCFLAYSGVEVTLMFHGKYNIEFKDNDSLKKFDNKLYELS